MEGCRKSRLTPTGFDPGTIYICKGKAIPLQDWTGPEAPRFQDSRQYEGGKVSPWHRPPLPPGNTPGTHFC